MPKFESPINVKTLKGQSNTSPVIIHLGDDNRVGIGTENPETKLHVNGAITATGLVLPAGLLVTDTDVAEFWGYNPLMDEFYTDLNGHLVANGYTQDNSLYSGDAEKSEHRVLGQYSAKFTGTENVLWSREVEFAEPLYANVFLNGSYSYKFGSYTRGEPGFAITLTHREKANSEFSSDSNKTWSTETTNTFIAPVFSGHAVKDLDDPLGWQMAGWRATTPGNREITRLKIEIISSTTEAYRVNDNNRIHLSQASGNAEFLGGGEPDYEWYLDGLGFKFYHPDMRIDQYGRITGAYIAFASITDAHIKNYIASHNSRIEDNPSGGFTAVPYFHQDYFTLDDADEGVVDTNPLNQYTFANDTHTQTRSKLSKEGVHDALVANSTYATGWSIHKSGDIRGTGLVIYDNEGNILFSSKGFGGTLGLEDLDPVAYTYLYNLSFEESNETALQANLGFLAETSANTPGGVGTGNVISSNVYAFYVSNGAFDEPYVNYGGLLANGYITLNGQTVNAPPGSYTTGGDITVKNKSGYLLFLANTQKWSTDGSNAYYYNSNLGDYGLYTMGLPTDAGWVYHPSANDVWQDLAPEFVETDFKAIGRIYTGEDAEILGSTHLDTPRNLDTITENFGLGGQAPPLGIIAGGVMFADLKLNRKNHAEANGWVQFINQRNSPNTDFVFIHPGGYTDDAGNNPSNILYECNSAYGVSTVGLENLPGSRYIIFVGGNSGRTFSNLPIGHSPDFISGLPVGSMPVTWYYEDQAGVQIEFTPCANDCIVARVDNLDSLTHPPLDQAYIYSNRNAMSSEGGFLDDMIIDPPEPADAGGILFADMHINNETDSDGNLTANLGFIAFKNPHHVDPDEPENHFYVWNYEKGTNYAWLSNNSNRGVITTLNWNQTDKTFSRDGGNKTGTRHILFVGHKDSGTENRFVFASPYDNENVSNDFIAVTKYDEQGIPHPDSTTADPLWYYDNGANVTSTFLLAANDFIVASVRSFARDRSGIDQIVRYSGSQAVGSGGEVFDSLLGRLGTERTEYLDSFTAAGSARDVIWSRANDAFQIALGARDNVAVLYGLEDAQIKSYFDIEGAEPHGAENGTLANNAPHNDNFNFNDIWINTSVYNRYIDGSWTSNAIFRYANTNQGFLGTLGWRHDHDNPIGQHRKLSVRCDLCCSDDT